MKSQDARSIDDNFFGSVTVGERGQVVIPAEARKMLSIHAGDKLLVLGHPSSSGLVMAKLDSMREFITSLMEGLREVEETSPSEAENAARKTKDGQN